MSQIRDYSRHLQDPQIQLANLCATALDRHTMSGEHENGSPAAGGQDAPPAVEHLNIKVTDNNNEVFFKIKRSTKLEKLMTAFCERQGKAISSVRFLFEGQRVQPTDTPDTLEMADGDTLEVHQEQVGGSN
ncbi:ubiquitin family protein [Colletotrichum camelliae]|nr:ubiquitin family protein [Colletotrichum camelliae]